jgi:hypothetical protein
LVEWIMPAERPSRAGVGLTSWRLAALLAAPVIVIIVLALETLPGLQDLPLLLLVGGGGAVAGESIAASLRAAGLRPPKRLGLMSGLLVPPLVYVYGRAPSPLLLFLVTAAVVFDVLFLALALISETARRQLRGFGEFFAVFAPGAVAGFLLSHLLLIASLQVGLAGVVLAFVIAWATEIVSRLVHRGGERSFVGVGVGVVAAYVVFAVAGMGWMRLPSPQVWLIGGAAALAAQAGDLAGAALKTGPALAATASSAEPSDKARLLLATGPSLVPGLDSLIFVAPALFYGLLRLAG